MRKHSGSEDVGKYVISERKVREQREISLTEYVLSGIIYPHTLSLIISEIQVFLSQNPANFLLLYLLHTRPCLWVFPLRNNNRGPQKIISLPQPGNRASERDSEKCHEDLHSPFSLFKLTVLQELFYLLPAMLLMFWALCKVVQDSGEAAGYGVMA